MYRPMSLRSGATDVVISLDNKDGVIVWSRPLLVAWGSHCQHVGRSQFNNPYTKYIHVTLYQVTMREQTNI